MITAEDIKRMAKEGQSQNVIFRLSVPQMVRDITEDVCSLANVSDGYLLLGIDVNGSIKGVSINDSKISAIRKSIGTVSPFLRCEIYQIDVYGKKVLVIDVPVSMQLPYVFEGTIFVREGVANRKITSAQEIRKLFQQTESIYYDSLPSKTFDLYDNIDSDMMRTFRREASMFNAMDDREFFQNIKAFADDGNFKLGSILFFARQPQNLLFHAVIRCTQYKGTFKLHVIDDKTFVGPLVSQYEQALGWIKSKLNLEYDVKGTGPRIEKWEMPLDVFKEALINSLTHRDYSDQGAFISVEVYEDRIEISNPGGLLPKAIKYFGRKSLSRNPYISSLFMRMNLVEHVGSGIGRMKELMMNAGLQAPVFETEGMFNVILYRSSARDATSERRIAAQMYAADRSAAHDVKTVRKRVFYNGSFSKFRKWRGF